MKTIIANNNVSASGIPFKILSDTTFEPIRMLEVNSCIKLHSQVIIVYYIAIEDNGIY